MNGKGIAFNQKELAKLKGSGIMDVMRKAKKAFLGESDEEEEEVEEYEDDNEEDEATKKEAVLNVTRFLKHRIKKGKKIPPEVLRFLLKLREDPEFRKYVSTHRMKKYITFDESGGAIVKRGGSWWTQTLKYLPNIVNGVNGLVNTGIAVNDAISAGRTKQQQEDILTMQNRIIQEQLNQQYNALRAQGTNPQVSTTIGNGCKPKGCGRTRLSKEEFLERMRRGKEAKKKKSQGGSMALDIPLQLFTDLVIPGGVARRKRMAAKYAAEHPDTTTLKGLAGF